MTRVKAGSLDHVHIVVPDREAAAKWYKEALGFEPIQDLGLWAEIEGGPLHLSADGGVTGVALFQAWDSSVIPNIGMGVGFKLAAEEFIHFANGLADLGIPTVAGDDLKVSDIVDFELSFAYSFCDPYGNQLELNCYDYEPVRLWLKRLGVVPKKHW